MVIEAIQEESKRKSNSNGSNGNGNKPILINHINEEDQNKVNAIGENGYKHQNYNTTTYGNKNEPVKCTHCKKQGHPVEKCFSKFPALRPQNQQKQNNNQSQSSTAKKYCKYCEKEGHLTDKCYNLEKTLKKINASDKQIKINTVQKQQNETQAKN